MNVINFHLTNNCNYNCAYCFGKFSDNKLSLEQAFIIVDNIYRYFKRNDICDGRINLAGGEPLLYPFLDELIDYIKAYGIKVSVITNGSLLTEERIKAWKDRVYCIGLSIDSALKETNLKSGRCCGEKVLTLKQVIRLSQAMHRNGIKLKINTVVSKLNVNEDMTELYRRLKPDRLKLLQVEIVENINDKAVGYKISKKEFDEFCKRHKKCCRDTKCEYSDDMENSYIMINPDGEVQLNDGGKYKIYDNCFKEELYGILKSTPIDTDKFNSRYDKKTDKKSGDKKICVIGGHKSWLKGVKEKIGNADFFGEDNFHSVDVIINADEIWIQPNAISHSLYNKVVDTARAYGIPVNYFSCAGVMKCVEQFSFKNIS